MNKTVDIHITEEPDKLKANTPRVKFHWKLNFYNDTKKKVRIYNLEGTCKPYDFTIEPGKYQETEIVRHPEKKGEETSAYDFDFADGKPGNEKGTIIVQPNGD